VDPYTGGRLASAVEADELDRYIVARQRDGAADATIANELRALRTAFRLAKRHRRLATIPEFEIPEPKNVRECFFTVDQLDRLLTFLPVHLRAPVRFATLTGWRAANIFHLTWEHVDFGRGQVRVPIGQTKTGEPFRTPFEYDSELARLLRHQEQLKRGPFVFHHGDGNRIKSYDGSWRSAVRKLGADGYGEQQGTRVLKRFHDLRHTFAQHMTEAGVPQAVIMELGTWKTPATFGRYRITGDQAKRQAVVAMEQYIAAERQRAVEKKVVPIREAV
jgi:integrase